MGLCKLRFIGLKHIDTFELAFPLEFYSCTWNTQKVTHNLSLKELKPQSLEVLFVLLFVHVSQPLLHPQPHTGFESCLSPQKDTGTTHVCAGHMQPLRCSLGMTKLHMLAVVMWSRSACISNANLIVRGFAISRPHVNTWV